MVASTGEQPVRDTGRVDDLRVAPGPGAPRGLLVPAAELDEKFSRASGPGGQHVNTSDWRVQPSLGLAATSALDPTQRERLMRVLSARRWGSVLAVTGDEHRCQRRNPE